MSLSIYLLVIVIAVIAYVSIVKFGYSLGKEDGYKEGYAKGRKEVNEHVDSYLRMGEWSA